MNGVDFFREKLCTGEEETKRFEDFVSYVNEYGLEYEVFDLCMEHIVNSKAELSRDQIEDQLSIHAMGWDL